MLKHRQAAKMTTLQEYLRGMPEGQPGVLFQTAVGKAPQNKTKKLLERGCQVRSAQTTKSCCIRTSRRASLGWTLGCATQPTMKHA